MLSFLVSYLFYIQQCVYVNPSLSIYPPLPRPCFLMWGLEDSCSQFCCYSRDLFQSKKKVIGILSSPPYQANSLHSSVYFFLISIFLIFWPRHTTYRILVPQPGIELEPPALEAPSFNHWTAREFPTIQFQCCHLREAFLDTQA